MSTQNVTVGAIVIACVLWLLQQFASRQLSLHMWPRLDRRREQRRNRRSEQRLKEDEAFRAQVEEYRRDPHVATRVLIVKSQRATRAAQHWCSFTVTAFGIMVYAVSADLGTTLRTALLLVGGVILILGTAFLLIASRVEDDFDNFAAALAVAPSSPVTDQFSQAEAQSHIEQQSDGRTPGRDASA